MAYLQWLVPSVVAIFAVMVAIYFGVQNSRHVTTQRERNAGYASGRVEAKLENIEQILRGVNEKLDAHGGKLDAHDTLLRELRREAKKQGRRLRKLDERVEKLESSPTDPPTEPPANVLPLHGGVSAVRREGRAT